MSNTWEGLCLAMDRLIVEEKQPTHLLIQLSDFRHSCTIRLYHFI